MKTVCFAFVIILVIAARKWRTDPSSDLPACVRQKLGSAGISIEAYRYGSQKLFRVHAKGKELGVYDESCVLYCEKSGTSSLHKKDCQVPAGAIFLNRYEPLHK